jgi:PKHD-type hydroxylase
MNTFYSFPLDYSTNPSEYYWFKEGFNKEELDIIEKDVQLIKPQYGTIASGGDPDDITGIRKSTIRWMFQDPKFEWIYNRISELVTEANNAIWKFDITGMPEAIQYTEYYDNGGHYDWHMDCGPGELSTRKVSVTVQLSDSDEYEGGDLEFMRGSTAEQAPRGKGVVVIFPSYMLHRVTPITKGTRKSFVLWLGGSHYR